MAISYPLSLPSTAGIASISFRMHNASVTSRSPFTFKRQVFAHPGQMWAATVTLPPGDRSEIAPWAAFLAALKGSEGTFLMGNPDYPTPRGTVSSCTLSGSTGDESASVTMTGTLLAGDFIQLGAGSAAKLHMVLEDQSGSGTLEIWPALRADYTSQTVIFDDAVGLFSLASNMQGFDIDRARIYGVSFEVFETISG